MKTVCHQDGTLSYWSTTDALYRVRSRFLSVADRVALPEKDRERIAKHTEERHAWVYDPVGNARLP